MSNSNALWNPLEADKIQEAFSSKKFDIDYFCIRNQLTTIFNHRDFARLMSGSSGQIYRHGHTVRLRNGQKTEVYCIGDIADFKIGLIIESCIEDDGSIGHCLAVEEEEPGMSISGQKQAINQLLSTTLNGKLPFVQLQEALLGLFAARQVAIFKYGQKQDFRSFRELFKELCQISTIDVALGMEIGIFNRALIASKSGFKSKAFYRLFGCENGGNILICDAEAANLFCPGASRLCIYSNSQHVKSKFPYHLSFRSPLPETSEIDDERSGREPSTGKALLKKSIAGVLDDVMAKIIPAVKNSRLRAEVYFCLAHHSLEEMKSRLEQMVKRKVSILEADGEALATFLLSLCNFVMAEMQIQLAPTFAFSALFRLLTVYRQLIGMIYADWQISSEASHFGLLQELFERGSTPLKLEVLLQIDTAKIGKLVAVIGARQRGPAYATLLAGILLEVEARFGSEELSPKWFGCQELASFWKRLVSVNGREGQATESEGVSFRELLRLLARKHRASVVLKLFFAILGEFQTSRPKNSQFLKEVFAGCLEVTFQHKRYFLDEIQLGVAGRVGSSIRQQLAQETYESAIGGGLERFEAVLQSFHERGVDYVRKILPLPPENVPIDKDFIIRCIWLI